MNSPLQVVDLCKSYGETCAVNRVSFALKEGEIFGLLGPNGAGKTTMISMITTLTQPSSGEIYAFGSQVTAGAKRAKASIGVVPQELVNHGFFNIVEILDFHSGYYGLWRNRERINYLIERLGLWEHRHKKVKQLSGGMKRRLLIAKALVHQPRLLLLDEPTAGVDIDLRQSLWDFVRDLKKEGITILLTTHYLEEAEELCDRVGIIQEGEVKLIGETRGIIKDLTQREVCLTLNRKCSFEKSPYFLKAEGDKVWFRIPAELGVGAFLLEAQVDSKWIQDIKIREGTLEDVFKIVLGGTNGD